jgi:hypothetical protein
MKCIWEGSLLEVWDNVQLCRIIENLHYWIVRHFRPWISSCIDRWRVEARRKERIKSTEDDLAFDSTSEEAWSSSDEEDDPNAPEYMDDGENMDGNISDSVGGLSLDDEDDDSESEDDDSDDTESEEDEDDDEQEDSTDHSENTASEHQTPKRHLPTQKSSSRLAEREYILRKLLNQLQKVRNNAEFSNHNLSRTPPRRHRNAATLSPELPYRNRTQLHPDDATPISQKSSRQHVRSRSTG